MAEPNKKGEHPGPSRSEPSKGKRYEDLTEVQRKAAAAGKKSQNVAPSKQVDNTAPFQLGPPIRDLSGYLDLFGQPGPGSSGLPGGIIQAFIQSKLN